MKFVALDVETANPDLASICSVGLVVYEDGRVVSEFYSLVDPKSYFAPFQVRVHGIRAADVSGAPVWAELSGTVFDYVAGSVVVSHTPFDRVAVGRASVAAGVDVPDCVWLDSARLARSAWPECARNGYGLAAVCRMIGYEFDHHHALADARAAGEVVVAAVAKIGVGFDGLGEKGFGFSSLGGNRRSSVRRLPSCSDGGLAGEVVVFTGALTLLRSDAAELAASVGAEVGGTVTRKTTLLVVGDLDTRYLAGHQKSTKQRKAEKLIEAGAALRIVGESDFRRLVEVGLRM